MSAVYAFYDINNNLLDDSSIETLESAYYYQKNSKEKQLVGGKIFYINNDFVSSEDKYFIIYPSEISNNFSWSKSKQSANCLIDEFGYGKHNTRLAIKTFKNEIGTIWNYLELLNSTFGGCTDWYIATSSEYNKLRLYKESATYFNSNFWTSSELIDSPETDAIYWSCGCKMWNIGSKDLNRKIIPIRSV